MKTEPLHKTLSKLVSDCHCAAYAAERARVAHGRATVEGLPNAAGRVLYAEGKEREAERLRADLLPRLDAARKTVKAAPHVAGKAAALAAVDALTEAARLGFSPDGWEAQALRDVAYQIEAPDPHPAADIIEAVRTEGAATRETVTGGFRGLLEKVGLIRKRATWPRVSLKAQNRAAVLWDGWPGVSVDTGRGGAKVDCFEYYKTELAGYKIESVEHFKAVIDAARKK
jgi:hypothetical protein